MTPTIETVRGSDALGIDPDHEVALSYYAGRIMLEIFQEEGPAICRYHIVRAVLSSPYLKDELERVYVVAGLCEALSTPRYVLLLAGFLDLTETVFRGRTTEEQLAIWSESIKDQGGLL